MSRQHGVWSGAAIHPMGWVAACAIGLALVGSGCRAIREARAERAEARAAVKAAERSVPARTPGLEVQIWAVTDTLGDVGRSLAGVVVDEDGDDARAWREAGLRVVSVEVDRVDSVRSRLSLAAPVHKQQIRGEATWAELAGGVETAGGRARIGRRSVSVGAGRGRLLGRSWFEPDVADDGVGVAMRIELVPQVVAKRDRDTFGFALDDDAPALGDVLGEGRVWRSLVLRLRADGTRAWLIVPEAPESTWIEAVPVAEPVEPGSNEPGSNEPESAVSEAATGVPERVPAGPRVAPTPGPELPGAPAGSATAVGSTPAGPPGPSAAKMRTLGEVLLSVDVPIVQEEGAEVTLTRKVELVVVLVPTVPGGDVSLLGGSR